METMPRGFGPESENTVVAELKSVPGEDYSLVRQAQLVIEPSNTGTDQQMDTIILENHPDGPITIGLLKSDLPDGQPVTMAQAKEIVRSRKYHSLKLRPMSEGAPRSVWYEAAIIE